MHEAQEGAGVGLHRARHVEQEHDPSRTLTGTEVVAAHRFAARPQRGAHRAAQVRSTPIATGCDHAARPTHGPDLADVGHQRAQFVQLRVAALGEVLVAKHLDRREPHRDLRLVTGVVALVVAGGIVVVLVVE